MNENWPDLQEAAVLAALSSEQLEEHDAAKHVYGASASWRSCCFPCAIFCFVIVANLQSFFVS